MTSIRSLETLPAPLRFALVGGLFGLLVIADYATQADIALRALYLLPVGLASWLLGRSVGATVGVVSAAVCVAFDWRAGVAHLHPGLLYVEAATWSLTYAVAAHVVEQLHEAHDQIDAFARSDAVTGIANVRWFHEAAQRELIRARRSGSALTVAQIDVDGFKVVNETRGHTAGDRLLAAVGKALGSGRGLDVAARIDGDEFALLLPDTTRAEAEIAVARLRERLTEATRSEGWPVTFSIAVVTFLSAPPSVAHAMDIADRLMSEVKRGAKSEVLFEESGEAPLPRRPPSHPSEVSELPEA